MPLTSDMNVNGTTGVPSFQLSHQIVKYWSRRTLTWDNRIHSCLTLVVGLSNAAKEGLVVCGILGANIASSGTIGTAERA